MEPVEVPILGDFEMPCVSLQKSPDSACRFGSVCCFHSEFDVPGLFDLPFLLLCVNPGSDSVDRPILVDLDSKLIGRPEDSGVSFQALNLNFALGSVGRTISICRTRVQTYFEVVFG